MTDIRMPEHLNHFESLEGFSRAEKELAYKMSVTTRLSLTMAADTIRQLIQLEVDNLEKAAMELARK